MIVRCLMLTWTMMVRQKRPSGPRLMRVQKQEMRRMPDWPRMNQSRHRGGRFRKLEGSSAATRSSSQDGSAITRLGSDLSSQVFWFLSHFNKALSLSSILGYVGLFKTICQIEFCCKILIVEVFVNIFLSKS